MEAWFLVESLKLLLRPALGRLHRVLVEVAPSRLDRLRGNVVYLGRCKQLQRAGHKGLAPSRWFLFDEEGGGGELGSRNQRCRDHSSFGGKILVVILRPRALISGDDRFIQRHEVRVIGDLVSAIRGPGLSFLFFDDRFKGPCVILRNFNFCVNTRQFRTGLDRLPSELELIQELQFRREVERQFMGVAGHLLDLPAVVSGPISSRQHNVEVSLNEWHGGILLHTRSVLVVLQPGQEVVPGVNSDIPRQVLQGLLHIGDGNIEGGLVSVFPGLMGNIMPGRASASAALVTLKILWTEGGRARGACTSTASASTSTVRTKRRKPAVSTTAAVSSSSTVRRVHTPVFKVTGRGATARETGTSVGEARAAVREAEV